MKLHQQSRKKNITGNKSELEQYFLLYINDNHDHLTLPLRFIIWESLFNFPSPLINVPFVFVYTPCMVFFMHYLVHVAFHWSFILKVCGGTVD